MIDNSAPIDKAIMSNDTLIAANNIADGLLDDNMGIDDNTSDLIPDNINTEVEVEDDNID